MSVDLLSPQEEKQKKQKPKKQSSTVLKALNVEESVKSLGSGIDRLVKVWKKFPAFPPEDEPGKSCVLAYLTLALPLYLFPFVIMTYLFARAWWHLKSENFEKTRGLFLSEAEYLQYDYDQRFNSLAEAEAEAEWEHRAVVPRTSRRGSLDDLNQPGEGAKATTVRRNSDPSVFDYSPDVVAEEEEGVVALVASPTREVSRASPVGRESPGRASSTVVKTVDPRDGPSPRAGPAARASRPAPPEEEKSFVEKMRDVLVGVHNTSNVVDLIASAME